MPSSRAQAAMAVAVVALVGVFYVATLREGHPWGDDFAQYILHARNIVEGMPYAGTGYLLNPSYASLGPRAYPPVFPLLLAPLYASFGTDLAPMKLLVVAAFLLFLVILYFMLRRELPFPWLIALILLVGLNPFFWGYKDQVLSDVPFLTFAYGSLLWVQAARRAAPSGGEPSLGAGAVAGALVYLAYGTRSLGVILVGCLILGDLLASRRVTRLTWVAVGVFSAGAAAQLLMVPGAGAYEGQVLPSPRHVPGNLAMYARTFSLIWDDGHGPGSRYVLGTVAAGLALYGFARRARREVGLLEVFGLVYLTAILCWSGRIDRYLMPVIPLGLFWAMDGLKSLAGSRPPVVRRAALAALVAGVGLAYGGAYASAGFGAFREGVDSPEARDLFAYVRSHCGPGEVVIFRKPRALALYAGRSASIYNRAPAEEEQWRYFDRIGATWFVWAREDPDWWLELLQRGAPRLAPAHENAGFRLFVRPPPDGPGRDPAEPTP